MGVLATPIRAAGTLDLTVHLRDPDIEPDMRPANGDGSRYRALTEHPDGNALITRLKVREWVGHAGATVCGKRLLLEELWIDYEPGEDDTCCPRCFDGAPDDVEASLWDDDDDYAYAPEEAPGRSVETVTVAGGVL